MGASIVNNRIVAPGSVFQIRRTDTLPKLTFLFDNTYFDALLDEVVFRMRNLAGTVITPTGTAAIILEDADGGTAGKVTLTFTFSAADTATAGLYQCYFILDDGANKQQTVPTTGYILVEVVA